MANPSTPWASYCALISCCLVALDKRPGVHPIYIGETLRGALAKLVMRTAGNQAKTACGNLQLCTGLKAVIEVATHDVGQRRLERVRGIQQEEVEVEETEEEDEESGGVMQAINNLTIDKTGTEKEVTEGLEVALGMEVE